MPCIPTYDCHTVRASTYMDDYVDPIELRKQILVNNEAYLRSMEQESQASVPKKPMKEAFTQVAPKTQASKTTQAPVKVQFKKVTTKPTGSTKKTSKQVVQYRGPSYRGRPVGKMEDKKMQVEVQEAVKDYLNKLIANRSDSAKPLTSQDLLDATKSVTSQDQSKAKETSSADNYILEKVIKPSISVLHSGTRVCEVKTPSRRPTTACSQASQAESTVDETASIAPTNATTMLPTPSPTPHPTPKPTTPFPALSCPPTPASQTPEPSIQPPTPTKSRPPSTAKSHASTVKSVAKSTKSTALSETKESTKEPEEEEEKTEEKDEEKKDKEDPPKKDYHWMIWKTGRTPLPPPSPVPSRPHSAVLGRKSAMSGRRSVRSATPHYRPGRVPTPDEMRPYDYDNMTTTQLPPDQAPESTTWVPALKAWVNNANNYEREVAYNLFNALNSGMTATKIPNYNKARTRSAALRRSPSPFNLRPKTPVAGIRTSLPSNIQRPNEQEQLLQIVAKSLQQEQNLSNRGYTNMNSALRPRITHLPRPGARKDFVHENSFFMNAQEPYRKEFTIHPQWVSETKLARLPQNS